MGLTDKPDTDYVTLLYREMEICSEYLHCTHEEFKHLTLEEKMKWYLFVEAKIEKQKAMNKKQKRERQQKEAEVRSTLSGKKEKPLVRDLS